MLFQFDVTQKLYIADDLLLYVEINEWLKAI